MAPARTGKERRRRITVMKTLQTNNGRRSKVKVSARMLITVDIKLIAPRIEEAPARWREKIERSTEAPECAMLLDKGGQTVHPVPAPASTSDPLIKSIRAGGKSQNLMLLSRGKAMSGAPNISGKSQFPNPPIIIGITIKKIIIKAWAVTITLQIWSSPISLPG